MKLETEPERWKQYDDKYWVSDQGRVKREYKNGNVHYLTPVKRSKSSKYKGVRVKVNNKYVNLKRLVWETFRGAIPEGYAVIHKNECHTMNDLYNLRLIKLESCYNLAVGAKAKSKPVIDLRTGKVYPSARCAARHLYLCHEQISRICRGLQKSNPYHIEWYDEEKKYNMELKFIRRDELH